MKAIYIYHCKSYYSTYPPAQSEIALALRTQAATEAIISKETEHLRSRQARHIPNLLLRLRLWLWLWLGWLACVIVVGATLAMNRESGLFFLECKRNRNEFVLIVVVAMVAWHYDARIANLHLGPCVLGEGINTEQTVTSVRLKDREEV